MTDNLRRMQRGVYCRAIGQILFIIADVLFVVASDWTQGRNVMVGLRPAPNPEGTRET